MEPLQALQHIAARQLAQGRPLEAVKCLEACLGLGPMPADEAHVRLRAARVLLAHTSNLAEAKQHLQKAQLLVQRLPSHHLLKCEVAALLGRAHKYAGEADYERAAYEKGLAVCDSGTAGPGAAADSATRTQLQRWACHFHLRVADALAGQGDSGGAGAALQRALEVAQKHGLGVEELVARMSQLQLCLAAWDRPGAEAAIQAVVEALQAGVGGEASTGGPAGAGAAGDGGQGGGAAQQADGPALQQLKLHFNILQIIYSIRLGHYDQLVKPADGPDSGGANAPPAAISTMEELLAAVRASSGGGGGGSACAYEWLPLAAQEGVVAVLAAAVLRAQGKIKPAAAHVAKGLAAVDGALADIGAAASGPAAGPWGEQHLHESQVWPARALAALRALLLEARSSLHLLASDFAAARADVAAGLELYSRFPELLKALKPALHMQAGQYAHAVGAWAAAAAHYGAAAAEAPDPLAEAQARCLRAMAVLAAGGPDAAGEGIASMGDLYSSAGSGPEDAGYAERVLAQTAGALLRMATPGEGPERDKQLSEAKVLLGKALKAAHNRLHNHQLVTQLLNAMAPLRVESSDVAGAQQMLTSSFTLAKGMGDVNGQVAALEVLQQVYQTSHQAEQAAQNSNYLARKKADLAARLAAAEAGAAEHAAVLAWGL